MNRVTVLTKPNTGSWISCVRWPGIHKLIISHIILTSYTYMYTYNALMSSIWLYMYYEYIYGYSVPTTMMYRHACIWYGYPYVLCVHIHVFTTCTSVFLHYKCVYVYIIQRYSEYTCIPPQGTHTCIFAHIHNVPRHMINYSPPQQQMENLPSRVQAFP